MTTTSNKLWQAAKALIDLGNVPEDIINPIDDVEQSRILHTSYGLQPVALHVPWPPRDLRDVVILSHEVGHNVTIGHDNGILWRELKATLWGFQALERAGIPVTDEVLAIQQGAFRTYAVPPQWAIDQRHPRALRNVAERDQSRHTPAFHTFLAAKSINDPKLQELLKGTYDRT